MTMIIALGAFACTRPGKAGKRSPAEPPDNFSAELRLPLASHDADEARQLFADGQPVVATLSGDTLTYRFTAAFNGDRAHFPHFEAMAAGLCGWSRQGLQLSEPDAAVVKRAAAAGKPVIVRALWSRPESQPPSVRLLVDNRAGDAATLSYAIHAPLVMQISVPAHVLFRTEVLKPACAGAVEFTLDGHPLGALPEPLPGTAPPWAYWLDPSGQQCYREARIIYAKFSDAIITGGTLAVHAPAHWHQMRVQDDYILESAPQRITEQDSQIDTLGKIQWQAEACSARGHADKTECADCAKYMWTGEMQH